MYKGRHLPPPATQVASRAPNAAAALIFLLVIPRLLVHLPVSLLLELHCYLHLHAEALQSSGFALQFASQPLRCDREARAHAGSCGYLRAIALRNKSILGFYSVSEEG